MRVISKIFAVSILIGSAHAASAAHKTVDLRAHHAAHANDYLAVSPNLHDDGPADADRGTAHGPFQTVPDGTTGGPVGGTGS